MSVIFNKSVYSGRQIIFTDFNMFILVLQLYNLIMKIEKCLEETKKKVNTQFKLLVRSHYNEMGKTYAMHRKTNGHNSRF